MPTTKYGEALKAQVDERLQFFETGQPPTKNLEVMQKVMAELDSGGASAAAGKKQKKRKQADGEEEPAAATPTPKKLKKKAKAVPADAGDDE